MVQPIGKLYPYGSPTNEVRLIHWSDIVDLLGRLCSVNIQLSELSHIERKYQARPGGSLAKRLQKYVYDTYGCKLTPQQKSELGSFIAECRGTKGQLVYEIREWMDWDDGDFGDPRSCFWSDREYAKIILHDLGCRYLCGYLTQGDGSLKGMHRCIMLPYEGGWVLFNAYPKEHNGVKSLEYFAKVLTKVYPELAGKKSGHVWLRFNGMSNDLLYVNGRQGLLVGVEHAGEDAMVDIPVEVSWKKYPSSNHKYVPDFLAIKYVDCYAEKGFVQYKNLADVNASRHRICSCGAFVDNRCKKYYVFNPISMQNIACCPHCLEETREALDRQVRVEAMRIKEEEYLPDDIARDWQVELPSYGPDVRWDGNVAFYSQDSPSLCVSRQTLERVARVIGTSVTDLVTAGA